MQRAKPIFLIGSVVIGITIIVVAIFLLRRRSVEEEFLPSRRPSASRVTQPSRTGTASVDRGDLTPAEQKRADEVTAAIRSVPKDQRTTWTPEFRKKMETNDK